ncbi:alpha/beta hydrolase [Novosphingobium sp.]|uniref:alpha/beta hydrolase n=1 Tax=Novosphingobium sp. TaxID=1874826 RepID=UPI002602AAD4|nr:alpha/beta hydrolase [Novosphingobium sp.]
MNAQYFHTPGKFITGILTLAMVASLHARVEPPAPDPWREPRMIDLRSGEERTVGVKRLRWTADANHDGNLDAAECEVRAPGESAWKGMDPQSFDHLVKWSILMEMDPAPSYVYATEGGRSLRVFVDVPPASSQASREEKRPAAVFFFGGSWSVGWQGEFLAYAEYLAKRGMVCFRVDYRVGFRDGNESNELRATLDARAALRWIISNASRFGVDPERLVTLGESAGGHLAIASALAEKLEPSRDDPSLTRHVKAIVSAFPVSETGDRRISPWHLISPDMPPLFLTWGTNDVFAEKLDKFVAHARGIGLAPTIHIEPEAKHGFILFGRYQSDSLARIDAFLTDARVLRAGEKITLGPDFTVRQSQILAAYRSRRSGF